MYKKRNMKNPLQVKADSQKSRLSTSAIINIKYSK